MPHTQSITFNLIKFSDNKMIVIKLLNLGDLETASWKKRGILNFFFSLHPVQLSKSFLFRIYRNVNEIYK